MFINNVSYSPSTFADQILIEAVNLSRKSKDFLKEKSIKTLLQFASITDDFIDSAPSQNTKREISDFKQNVLRWMSKNIQKLKFSHNIPPPCVPPRREEWIKLIALLLVEPLLGNRRNVSYAKKLHVKRLYEDNGFQRKNRSLNRSLRKLPIAA